MMATFIGETFFDWRRKLGIILIVMQPIAITQ
ncbi:MAG: hypothetical protein JWQ09_5431 [Segetibacter sp.]|nr:hypothetical protein [Segetibacter sp.]